MNVFYLKGPLGFAASLVEEPFGAIRQNWLLTSAYMLKDYAEPNPKDDYITNNLYTAGFLRIEEIDELKTARFRYLP